MESAKETKDEGCVKREIGRGIKSKGIDDKIKHRKESTNRRRLLSVREFNMKSCTKYLI